MFGLHSSELLGLTWGAVDLDGGRKLRDAALPPWSRRTRTCEGIAFMPVTDPAGTAARAAMLAHGWPDHTAWNPDPGIAAALDELTARRRAALDYEWHAVTDPAPPAVSATLEALHAALVDAGLPGKLAELAADFSHLTELGGIVAVVRWTATPKPPGWSSGQPPADAPSTRADGLDSAT